MDLAYLSHLGQFADKHGYDLRRTFTLTNTDEIPGLVELLEAFPDLTFSVGALTLMGDDLHDLGRRYPNLTLIPTINHKEIREELEQAPVYLDINAGAHVLDVVKAAYHLNLVVLALTAHAKAPGLRPHVGDDGGAEGIPVRCDHELTGPSEGSRRAPQATRPALDTGGLPATPRVAMAVGGPGVGSALRGMPGSE